MSSSSTSAQDFLYRLETDVEFRNSVTNSPHPAGKISIIREAGFEFTSEELNAAMGDEETSKEAREHAREAVRNIAPEDTQYDAVGWWMWWIAG